MWRYIYTQIHTRIHIYITYNICKTTLYSPIYISKVLLIFFLYPFFFLSSNSNFYCSVLSLYNISSAAVEITLQIFIAFIVLFHFRISVYFIDSLFLFRFPLCSFTNIIFFFNH